MHYLKQQIELDFRDTVNKIFSLTIAGVSIRTNQTIDDFDYQIDICFILAKQLKKIPIEIAELIINNLGRHDIYQRLQVSKPGFINIKIDERFLQSYFAKLLNNSALGILRVASPQTIVVDYGCPNVAKVMHVGHLRSTIIGDALVRILTFLGHNVIRQNHIGDWGTQFGFLIQYIIEYNIQTNEIEEINKAYQEARKIFDNDQEFNQRAKQRVVLLQKKDPLTYNIWKNLSKISYEHFNHVFNQLGTLLKETDVRGESFYNDMLPSLVEEMITKNIAIESEGAIVIFLPGFYDQDKKPLPMIIQKSDGGYLYHTTDLAAAIYRINSLHADRIIYVADMRQKQHFAMLFSAVKQAELLNNSVILEHVAFGTVLGSDKKPFKTRSGETISLTSLLIEAEAKAKKEIKNKYPNIEEDELSSLGNIIGIGALKYADLSNELSKDYVFNWDRMLSFNGNTSLYLQNAYVRIISIFRKHHIDLDEAHNTIITCEVEKQLCLKVTEFPDIINIIQVKLTPHLLCNYLYELASLFHNFYETCPVVKCEEYNIKISRFVICRVVANTLKLGLNLLGINVVEKM